MPVEFRKWVTRADLRAAPQKFFVFGDNVARKGYGGQAKEMRGEPNAIGIPTKWAPSMEPSAMFYDHQRNNIIEQIQPDLDKVENILKSGRTIVWPHDGIGTGRAKLPQNAPLLVEQLNDWISKLVYE